MKPLGGLKTKKILNRVPHKKINSIRVVERKETQLEIFQSVGLFSQGRGSFTEEGQYWTQNSRLHIY